MAHAMLLISLALLLVAAALGAGHGLRVLIPAFRKFHIPASVLAGLLGFAAVQLTRQIELSQAVAKVLSGWTAPLIALVFAALLLPPSSDSFTAALRRGARSGLFAWIIILGQLLLGLLVYLVAFPSTVTPAATQLLEVSWAGGHGSATAMGSLYSSLKFPEGKDIALFLATAGLLYGVLGGLALVNLGIRRGWAQHHHISPSAEPSKAEAFAERPSVNRIPLQLLLLATAFGLGCFLQNNFELAARSLPPDIAKSLSNIPLFLFTLLAGLAVRQLLSAFKQSRLIDPPALDRITSVAMDILIVAALSTLRLESIANYALPITLLIAAGIAWSLVCLLILAPRVLPRSHWFELGLLNFGFSTANTPQGIMLLRIADPHLRSGAAEDYAVAAPLTAPFVGGGLCTFAIFPALLSSTNPWLIAAILLAAIIMLIFFGFHLARANRA